MEIVIIHDLNYTNIDCSVTFVAISRSQVALNVLLMPNEFKSPYSMQ